MTTQVRVTKKNFRGTTDKEKDYKRDNLASEQVGKTTIHEVKRPDCNSGL